MASRLRPRVEETNMMLLKRQADYGSSPAETYTLQEAIDHVGFGWFQIKISALAGLCFMADSMEIMLLSILGPVLSCEWYLSAWEEAFLTTLVFLGMLISSSFWGTMCDRLGRKPILIIGSSLAGYFGVLTALSPFYIWVCVNRFLVGFSLGVLPQTLTLYSEFLPTKSRAACMVCIEMFFAIGASVEVMLAKLVMPHLGWRYLLGFSAIPLLLFPILSYWLPESVRYYLASGQISEARAMLAKIAKENRKSLPPGELMDATTYERGHVRDMFTKSHRTVSVVLLTMWFLHGFVYYGVALLVPTLFTNPDGCHGSDISNDDTGECSVKCEAFSQADYNDMAITAFAEVPGLLIMTAMMTYLGRRHSVALCSAVFSAVLLVCNLCMKRTPLTFFLFATKALISGTVQGIYVYTTEVYPTSSRSVAMGMGSGMARVGALLTPYLAQIGTEANAHIGINGYTICGVAMALLALALPFETKGKAMQDSPDHHEMKN